jgi:hypothetical protein
MQFTYKPQTKQYQFTVCDCKLTQNYFIMGKHKYSDAQPFYSHIHLSLSLKTLPVNKAYQSSQAVHNLNH